MANDVMTLASTTATRPDVFISATPPVGSQDSRVVELSAAKKPVLEGHGSALPVSELSALEEIEDVHETPFHG